MTNNKRIRTWTGISALAIFAISLIWASLGSASPARSFSADITNPYFPLTPGTTLVYKGIKDGLPAVDYFTTTDQTVEIAGARCRVVLDRLFLSGKLAETTADYYTQDQAGDVHYYGEDTATIDSTGHMEILGTGGTWHASEFGAVPGIFMPASLQMGAAYRQEFLEGHAEDNFQILDLAAPITVPYGTFKTALLTKEWTPLEPDVLDHKYYVKGIGMVKEIAVKGPHEELVLVAIHKA